MGRYDKIKVYNSSGNTVQPKRIRVYSSNKWLDLGENDSYNNRALYVYKSGVKTRVTKYKVDVSHTGYTYQRGSVGNILGGNTCFSVNSSYNNTELVFTAYIRRTSSGSKNIFKMYGVYSSGSNYFYITLNSNGTISIGANTQYSSVGEASATTSNAISDSNWHHVKVRAPLGGSLMYVSLDGGAEASASSRRAWQVYANNVLGDSGLDIRSDNFYLKTADGNGYAVSTSSVGSVNGNDNYTTTEWR